MKFHDGAGNCYANDTFYLIWHLLTDDRVISAYSLNFAAGVYIVRSRECNKPSIQNPMHFATLHIKCNILIAFFCMQNTVDDSYTTLSPIEIPEIHCNINMMQRRYYVC